MTPSAARLSWAAAAGADVWTEGGPQEAVRRVLSLHLEAFRAAQPSLDGPAVTHASLTVELGEVSAAAAQERLI